MGALYPDESRKGPLRDVKGSRNKIKSCTGAELLLSVSYIHRQALSSQDKHTASEQKECKSCCVLFDGCHLLTNLVFYVHYQEERVFIGCCQPASQDSGPPTPPAEGVKILLLSSRRISLGFNYPHLQMDVLRDIPPEGEGWGWQHVAI